MADKDMIGKIAVYAFLLGTIIAILVGLWHAYTLETEDLTDTLFVRTNDTGGIIAWILVILGAIVGLLAVLGKGTITKAEVPSFLLAGIALLVMYAVFSNIYVMVPYYIGSLLAGVSLALSIFIAPAVGVLAIKAIWDIGKSV
ncbi:MAG: hypothetical protein QXS02_03740 [Candidatus Thermoplasmatota archaeon]